MNGLYRFIRALMIAVMHTIFPCKVYGKENLPRKGGYVLASNHTSMSDVIWLIGMNPRVIHFMGKAEIFKHKILGAVFRKMYVFPVRRGAGDRGAVQHAIDLLKNGDVLGIFPEGTRNKQFSPPKTGKSGTVFIATTAEVPIVPVSIYRKGAFLPFRKTVVRIGHPYVVVLPDDSRASLKDATTDLMGEITALWEQGK